ncbi:Heat shock transcription factor [Vanrija albida]|uniref:Heat shock transcription factor n=1 Tax=Vanrija albida TaxID=181172 RepID=A0ABR3PYD8_9TREE
MTTNLSAIAGPSRHTTTQPKVEPVSPLNSISDIQQPTQPSEGGVSKPGLSVGENGEVVKVPAFLNKLFSMVSDSETDDLIYWADSGDSFFVPNHERFGKELLPRFFKHANFSSFVRQLNMYGFHKVPHLQSGVLKNESPSELWEFVNPFFKRDQPQLLSRVTRKNNRPAQAPAPSQGSTGTRSSARQAAANAAIGSSGYGTVHLLTDGTIEGEAGPLIGPAGQLADLHAIQSGINAIRQTQAAIGADLKALQASNEHLWREAIESRDRQQKHEETIDLIVSFLERLFGTEGEGLKGLKEAMRRGGMGTRNREDSTSEEQGTKKRRRLMIEDSRDDNDQSSGSRLVEIQEPSSTDPYTSSTSGRSSAEPWSSTSHRFTALPTDEDGVSPYQSKTGFTPAHDPTLHQGAISPLSDAADARSSDNHAIAHYTGGANGENGLSLDPNLLQTTIGSLLQSPAAAEMFLNSLNASSQGQALSSVKAQNVQPSPPNSELSSDPTMALFSPLPHQQGIINQNSDLIGAYQKAADVGQDVDKLQESIDSLVRSMGLDLPQTPGGSIAGLAAAANAPNPAPSAAPARPQQPQAAHNEAPMSVHAADGAFDDSDFNVDEFLDSLAKNNADGGDEHDGGLSGI